MTLLARAVGISATALAKACKQSEIPVPPRGHWRLVETGKSSVILPLLKPEINPLLRFHVDEDELERISIVRAAKHAAKAVCAREPSSVADAEVGSPISDRSVEPREAGLERPDTEPCQVLSLGERAVGDPFAMQLFELADQYRTHTALQSLINATRSTMWSGDPATVAVLALWLDRAEASMKLLNPVDEIIRLCGDIAGGTATPEWWRNVSHGRVKR